MSGQASTTIAPLRGQNMIGCSTTNGVLHDGEVVRGGQPNGPDIVFGLVPDGTTNVTLTFAGGTQRQIPVVSGVVRATIPAGPVTVAFRNATSSRWSHRYPGG